MNVATTKRDSIGSSIIPLLQFDIKQNPSALPVVINLMYDTSLGLFKGGEFDGALKYINEAISLMPPDFVEHSCHDVCIEVLTLKGRILFSMNKLSDALLIFENLQRRVDNTADLFKVKYYFLETCSNMGRFEVVYDEFMDMLAADSETLCLVANDDSFLQQWIQETVVVIRELLDKFPSMSDMLELGDNPNRERRYFMKCLAQCFSGISLGRNANKVYLFVTPLLLGKMMLQEGLCEEMTIPILSVLGWILGSIHDPELGYHISNMCLDVGRSRHKRERTIVMAVFYRSLSHVFNDSLQDVAKSAYEGWKLSHELGENIWGPLCGVWVVLSRVYAGTNFETLKGIAREVEGMCKRVNNDFLLDVFSADLAVARGLADESMTTFDPLFRIEKIEDIPYSRASIRFARGMWNFFHDEHKVAYTCMKETGSLIEDTFGTPLHLLYRWFSCVVCACRYESYREEEETDKKKTFSIMEAMLGPNAAPPKSQRDKILDEFKKQYLEVEQLHGSFGRFMEPAYYLSQAEAVRLNLFDECSETSSELYEKATQSAKELNHVLLAAVACSRQASLPEFTSNARSIIVTKAIKLWNSMGASYMVSKLTKTYQLVDIDNILSSSINSMGFEAIKTSVSKSLDMSKFNSDSFIVLNGSSSSGRLRSSMNGEDIKHLKEQVSQKTLRIEQLNDKIEQLAAENEELRKSQQRAYAIAEIVKRNNEKSSCLPNLFRKGTNEVTPK